MIDKVAVAVRASGSAVQQVAAVELQFAVGWQSVAAELLFVVVKFDFAIAVGLFAVGRCLCSIHSPWHPVGLVQSGKKKKVILVD